MGQASSEFIARMFVSVSITFSCEVPESDLSFKSKKDVPRRFELSLASLTRKTHVTIDKNEDENRTNAQVKRDLELPRENTG